jgi:hypothetical protein
MKKEEERELTSLISAIRIEMWNRTQCVSDGSLGESLLLESSRSRDWFSKVKNEGMGKWILFQPIPQLEEKSTALVVVCLAVNLALLCLYHPLALSNSFLSLLLFKMFIPLTAAAVLPLSYRARAPRANCYECFGLLAACVCARVGDSDCSGRFFLSFPYYFFFFHSSFSLSRSRVVQLWGERALLLMSSVLERPYPITVERYE